MTENIKLEGKITLLSPLVHSEETVGVDAKFRRLKILHNGAEEQIPVLSGNSIRGTLRRIGAKYLLKRIGLESVKDTTYYTLFSGGSLKKGESAELTDIRLKREIRENIPLLSIFGTAIGQQMIQSRLMVGMGIPIAKETEGMTGIKDDNLKSVWDLLQEVPYTRLDDLESKSQDTKESEDKQQMRYTIETIIAGAELHHSFELRGMTDIEMGCFYSTLREFMKSPYLGGMSRTGHGLVKMDYALEEKYIALYEAFLEKNKERIRKFIETKVV